MSAATHAQAIGATLQGAASRLVARPLFWAAFVALGLALPIANTVSRKLPPPLPVLGQVPPF